jgi:SAM-dependent methyltransferase
MNMQRRILIVLAVILICTAGIALYFTVDTSGSNENPTSELKNNPFIVAKVNASAGSKVNLSADLAAFTLAPQKKEITIRNKTGVPVTYILKPLGSDENSVEKTLAPHDIDHLSGGIEIAIVFLRNNEEILYWLNSGKPYTFRYDENDELELYDGSHGNSDSEDLAPFVPTPMIIVEKMLEMAKVDENDIVFDLGCGDGRIVIMAAKKHGAHGVGIDIDPRRIEESTAGARKAGVEHLVEFRLEDAMKADISKATVVTLYLLTKSNELLRPVLEKKLKPGVFVVSHNYSIPGWDQKEIDFFSILDELGEEHYIYLYQK